jgi:hypothetical protein
MQRFYQEGLLDPNFYLLDYRGCDGSAWAGGRLRRGRAAARVADAFKAIRAIDVNVDITAPRGS